MGIINLPLEFPFNLIWILNLKKTLKLFIYFYFNNNLKYLNFIEFHFDKI